MWFYTELLGLTIKKQSKDSVIFHQGLVLVPVAYGSELHLQGFRSLLYVEVTDIQKRYYGLRERDIQVISPLECWRQSNRLFFRCCDLDDNLIEVFEKR